MSELEHLQEATQEHPLPEWVTQEPDPVKKQTMGRAVGMVRQTVVTIELVNEQMQKISGDLYGGYQQDVAAAEFSQEARRRIIKATEEAREELNRRAINSGIGAIKLHAALAEMLQNINNPQCREMLRASATISQLAEEGLLEFQKSSYLLMMLGILPEVTAFKRLSGLSNIPQKPEFPNQ